MNTVWHLSNGVQISDQCLFPLVRYLYTYLYGGITSRAEQHGGIYRHTALVQCLSLSNTEMQYPKSIP